MRAQRLTVDCFLDSSLANLIKISCSLLPLLFMGCLDLTGVTQQCDGEEKKIGTWVSTTSKKQDTAMGEVGKRRGLRHRWQVRFQSSNRLRESAEGFTILGLGLARIEGKHRENKTRTNPENRWGGEKTIFTDHGKESYTSECYDLIHSRTQIFPCADGSRVSCNTTSIHP